MRIRCQGQAAIPPVGTSFKVFMYNIHGSARITSESSAAPAAWLANEILETAVSILISGDFGSLPSRFSKGRADILTLDFSGAGTDRRSEPLPDLIIC